MNLLRDNDRGAFQRMVVLCGVLLVAGLFVLWQAFIVARPTAPLSKIESCGYLTAAYNARHPGIQWIWQDVLPDHVHDLSDGPLFATARDVISGRALFCFYRRNPRL